MGVGWGGVVKDLLESKKSCKNNQPQNFHLGCQICISPAHSLKCHPTLSLPSALPPTDSYVASLREQKHLPMTGTFRMAPKHRFK